jgi:hypothetical protein
MTYDVRRLIAPLILTILINVSILWLSYATYGRIKFTDLQLFALVAFVRVLSLIIWRTFKSKTA